MEILPSPRLRGPLRDERPPSEIPQQAAETRRPLDDEEQQASTLLRAHTNELGVFSSWEVQYDILREWNVVLENASYVERLMPNYFGPSSIKHLTEWVKGGPNRANIVEVIVISGNKASLSDSHQLILLLEALTDAPQLIRVALMTPALTTDELGVYMLTSNIRFDIILPPVQENEGFNLQLARSVSVLMKEYRGLWRAVKAFESLTPDLKDRGNGVDLCVNVCKLVHSTISSASQLSVSCGELFEGVDEIMVQCRSLWDYWRKITIGQANKFKVAIPQAAGKNDQISLQADSKGKTKEEGHDNDSSDSDEEKSQEDHNAGWLAAFHGNQLGQQWINPGPLLRPYYVLSLDGGGIRGAATLAQLKLLHERLGDTHALGSYFDLMCGTSTGGIIALGLQHGFTLDEIRDIYTKFSQDVLDYHFGDYSKSVVRVGMSLFGETGVKDTARFMDLLYRILGGQRMDSPGLTDAFVVSSRKGYLLPNLVTTNDERKDWLCVEGLRACSAAQPFFDVFRKDDCVYLDGGFLKNNPAHLAYMRARQEVANTGRQIILISIGTGTYSQSRRDQLERSRGGIMDLLFNHLTYFAVNSEQDDDIMKQHAQLEPQLHYYRFNTTDAADIDFFTKGEAILNHLYQRGTESMDLMQLNALEDLHNAVGPQLSETREVRQQVILLEVQQWSRWNRGWLPSTYATYPNRKFNLTNAEKEMPGRGCCGDFAWDGAWEKGQWEPSKWRVGGLIWRTRERVIRRWAKKDVSAIVR